MSSSEGPVRRRRIAGEGTAAAPAKKVGAKKAPAKKVGAKKASAKKVAAKNASAKKAPAKKVAVKKAPAKVPLQKQATKTPPPTKAPIRPQAPAAPAPVPPTKPAKPAKDRSLRHLRPPAGELRWLVPATVVTVAALVLGALLMVRGLSDRQGGDTAASQRQAASAADAAAETIFSYRYDKLDEHLTESKALMTKSFAKDFDKIAPALTELAPQRKIVVQALTRNAGPVACGADCSATKATILVFVDQARLVSDSKEPTVFGNRITLDMVKRNGTWLVDDIRAL